MGEAPLTYWPHRVDDMQVLAYDPAGPGRIVEVFGDLDRAQAVAVVVPGNAHSLKNYRTHTGGASPRANAKALAAALRDAAPNRSTVVIAWLGYRPPVGFVAGALRHAAVAGAPELARLIEALPSNARVTLIGHSYGALVCALAAKLAPVNDLVALASSGLGCNQADGLATTAQVWAARCDDDWVRYLPQWRLGPVGHGRQPSHPKFGARVFATAGVSGHSDYYCASGQALANMAHIVVGDSHLVTAPVSDARTTRSDVLPLRHPHQELSVRCPGCGVDNDRVVDSRPAPTGDAIRRRRECRGCGLRFTTFERVEMPDVIVRKRSGAASPFDRQKVLDGMSRAAKGRVPVETLERATAKVESAVRSSGFRELTSEQVGFQVLKVLRDLDPVAYVRFASVYKDFQGPEDFEKELSSLRKEDPPKPKSA